MLVKVRLSKTILLLMFSSSMLVGELHASSAETSQNGWKLLYNKVRNSDFVNWVAGTVNSAKEDANETYGKAVNKGKALLATTPLKEYVLSQEPVTVSGDFQLYDVG